MKNFWVKLLILTTIFLGCGDPKPDNLLSEEEVQEILSQLHMADAISDTRKKHILERKTFRNDIYDQILERYGLTRETFYESYEYYLEHPVQMDSIYQRIVRDFDRRMEEAYDEEYVGEKEEKAGTRTRPDIKKPQQ